MIGTSSWTRTRLVDTRAAEARTRWLNHMRSEFPHLSNPQFDAMLERGAKALTFELWRMAVTESFLAFDKLPPEFRES